VGSGGAGAAGASGFAGSALGGNAGNAGSGAGGSGGLGGTGALGGAGACAPASNTLPNDDPVTLPAVDSAATGQTHHFFKITVKDGANAAPIAGAQLETVNKIIYTSDKNGVVAFYEPGLMGLNVFFLVTHPGYQIPADGLGVSGKALLATEGGSGEIAMQRGSGTSVPTTSDLQTRLAAGAVPGRAECQAIRVFDHDNQRGVPLARLSAFGEDYWTDSQGMIAYCNPDHLGSSVIFDYFSHGYALLAGGTQVTLPTSKGGTAQVELKRTNIAERLYRLIGGGIYRDSTLLGLKAPLKSPNLLAQVLGSDTASTTIYKGKLFWMWQDTDRVSYTLGNFRGTAATSVLPSAGGLSQNVGVDFTYFVGSDGFAAPMCPNCDALPIWMSGIVSVPDAGGNEKLYAGYANVNGQGALQEAGLAVFDDTKQSFDVVLKDFAGKTDFQRPDGHPYKITHGTQKYVYYGALRIPAAAEAFTNPAKYEQFTPYGAAGSSELQHTQDGRLDYAFRAGGHTFSSDQLKAASVPADQDIGGHDLSLSDGKGITFTQRSTTWNAYRKRFAGIAQQVGGSSSFIGEIWHSEADTPLGPWVYAQKIITHDNYTFYNTFHHPEFDRGRFLFLEGTYTASYTNNPSPTPRYNYNQILYRVDLEDTRLVMPVAVYDISPTGSGDFVTKLGLTRTAGSLTAAFLAPDRPFSGAQPVAWSGPACAPKRALVLGEKPATAPLFYALPANTASPPPHTVPLYQYDNASGEHAYALSDSGVPAGFTRAAQPVALVWQNPIRVSLPVADYLGDLLAHAGDDQCLTASNGSVQVSLDASASESLNSSIVSYVWHLPAGSACEAMSGKQVSVSLPPGTYSIELEVTDAAGNISRDTLTVAVD